jgi:transketolase
MQEYNHKNYRELSGQLRLKVINLYHQVNAGHIGSSLSCIDCLIAVLFYNKNDEDTFILSKGHAAAALYASLNFLGEITDEQLANYYQDGTNLPAHPAPGHFKGIPFATGSLGHGLPIATGIAQAAKLKNEDSYAFVLMSDGETNEGTTWEAMHYAVSNKLDNLLIIIDRNRLQGFGRNNEVLGDTANLATFQAMGLDVVQTDGHNIEKLTTIIHELKEKKNEKPKVIIAETIKGKGVSYMEDRLEWHYLPMSPDQYTDAVKEITEKYLSTAPIPS